MKTAATIAIAIASIVIGKAHAADMPAPAGAPAVAPPVTYGNYATVGYGNYNWSGLYAGGNGGYSWADGFTLSNSAALDKINGGVVGGQVGYNWQLGVFVGGLEGDLQWSGNQGSVSDICGTGCTITASEKIDAFATLRARAGVAFDAIYFYGTAGGAWTNASTSVNVAGGGGSAGLNLSASKFGWTAGAGVEVALTGNWTGKLEYLFIDTGTISGTAPVPASLGGSTYTESAAIRDNIIRIGFNYRFSTAPGPFVRY
jgi:outer membrane immunogenic protein